MPPSALVIDDEPGICTLLREILTRQGYQVYEAKDGLSGLEQFYLVQPDIILVDISMPGCDGFTIVKEIRRQNLAVGILMVSALKHKQLLDQAVTSGADGYLNKPFRMTELLKEVQRINAVVRLRRTMLPSQTNWSHHQRAYAPLPTCQG